MMIVLRMRMKANSSIMALVHGEGQDRWYFSREELQRTPSVLSGIDTAKELSYRQQSANLIQDMGQRLLVTQLTINTAIVYMHRFYMFHSFSDMNRNVIAPCCLFLSAKLEEQPRKLEHVIKVANLCLQNTDQLDPKSEAYLQQAQDLVINESILLQTLGFELTVDHPHTYVVKITQLVRASKDLAQTSYFMATNSLHLTPFCIQHKPSVVACVCIHLACKWSNWEFPRSSDNKDWWEYVDPTVTKQTLDTICQEFLTIIENCPNRLKKRINTVTIYKGGHRPKPASEKSSKHGASANGDGAKSKEGSSSKVPASTRETSKGDHSASGGLSSSSVTHAAEQSNQQSAQPSSAMLTITSSAAVVETPTSKVMLPPLQPLTTKYASMPGLCSNSTNASSKSSSGHTDNAKVASGTKHKHREHDESSIPAKKLKTMHSGSSHLSQTKHPSSSSRSSFQSKHSLNHPPKSSSHSTPDSHNKLLVKSGGTQSHHSSSPTPQVQSGSSHSSHTHSSSSKLQSRSSSNHGNHSHHNSSKRHSNSHSSGSKPSSHKHLLSSPLDVKKSSGERHRRPSSSSTKPRPDIVAFGTPSTARMNDRDNGKKTLEDFSSPPGLQRLQKLPTPRPINVVHPSHRGPHLPSSGLITPPPPPLPMHLPPPPPPPPT